MAAIDDLKSGLATLQTTATNLEAAVTTLQGQVQPSQDGAIAEATAVVSSINDGLAKTLANLTPQPPPSA